MCDSNWLKRREERKTYYIRDANVSLTAKYSEAFEWNAPSVKVAMSLVVIYVVLSPKRGLSHFTESDLIISKRERKNWKRGSNRAQLPMMSASSKVLFRPNSVLNQTSTSASLITTIKISTAIFRTMALANDSGTLPWIIREVWEVQVNLVRKPLRIRLRRADLTGRD